MNQFTDWFNNSSVGELILTILSTSAVSALITGCFTSFIERRKAKARIEQINLEKQKEKEALQTKYDHERDENRKRAYGNMIGNVTNYKSMHDVVHKSDAEIAVQQYIPFAKEEEHPALEALLVLISNSDPFDGPNLRAVEKQLKHIRDLQ